MAGNDCLLGGLQPPCTSMYQGRCLAPHGKCSPQSWGTFLHTLEFQLILLVNPFIITKSQGVLPSPRAGSELVKSGPPAT